MSTSITHQQPFPARKSYASDRFFKAVMLTILLGLTGNTQLFAQLTGTKTIPGDYATITAAVTDLNTVGVGAGGVIFEIAPGYTETLTGRINLTATGTSTDQIIFRKDPLGSGANPLLTAHAGIATATGATMDGMWSLTGSDWVTIENINFTDPNTLSNTVMMEYGIGLFKASATDGANNNTIKGCTITLNRNNLTAPTSGPAFQGSNGIALLNCTPTAMQTALTVTAASGASSNNKFYSNTIQNVNAGITLSGYAAASPFTLADTGNDIGGTSGATGNTIINFGGGTSATVACAAVFVKDQWSFNVSYNTVDNNVGGSGGVNHPNINRGIFANSSSVGASATINNNTLTIRAAGTTSNNWCIDVEMAQTGSGNTISINNNLIQNCSYNTGTTGSFWPVFVTSAATTINIQNNTIQNCSYTGAITSGAFQAITTNLTSTGTTMNVSGNNINNITIGNTTATTGSAFGSSNSTSPGTLNFTGNTISNFTIGGTATSSIVQFVSSATITATGNTISGITRTGASGTVRAIVMTSPSNITVSSNTIENITWSTLTSTGSIDGIYGLSSGVNVTENNNIIRNFRTPTTGTLTGIREFGSTGNKTFQNNQIYNFGVTSGGAGGAAMFGISLSTGVIDASNNQIYDFINTGGSSCTLTGMQVSGGTSSNLYQNIIRAFSNGATTPTISGISLTGGTTNNVNRNKIYDLTGTTAAATVQGVVATGGTTNNIYNNLIGDLKAPAGTGLDAVRGIYANSSGTYNIYHNTIYLNATSTSVTTFGTSCITFLSTASTLNLQNNILINASVPAQEGANLGSNGVSAVIRRSAGTTGTVPSNYNVGSNRNVFWCNPAAGTNNHMTYQEGTTTITNPYNTFAAWKAFLVNREQNSVEENTGALFVNTTPSATNYLDLTGAVTQAESKGNPITSPLINIDFAGNARSATSPDAGAWEFAGTTPAPSFSAVSITPGGDQCTSSPHTVSLTITTAVGTITGAQLNFSFNGVAQTPVTMTNTSGDIWEGVIPASNTTSAANAVVTWSVDATNSLPLTGTYVGTSYSDEPLTGVTAVATANPATICAGSSVTLTSLLNKSVSATLGAGATTSATYSNPFYSAWSNTHNQHLVLASELTALGLKAGNITSLGLNITSVGTYAMLDFSVKMANTTATNMSAFVSPSFTQVYSTASLMPVSGINTMTFTTPFYWDGVSNVVIEICHGNSTSTLTMSRTCTADNTAFVSSIHTHKSAASAGSATCADFTTNLTTYSVRPQFYFTGNGAPTATTFSWSDGSSTIGTTATLVVNPTVTTNYTAELSALGCASIFSSPVTVTVNPLPAAPTATNSSQCGLGMPTASVTPNGGVDGTGQMYWWDASSNGNLLQGPPMSGSVTNYYTNDFSSATLTNSFLSGAAAIASGVCTLHPALTSQAGGFTVNASGVNSTIYNVNFDLIATATGTTIADGFSYSFADDAAATTSTPSAEHGSGSKLRVGFFTYNAASGSDGKGIYLMYGVTATSGYTSSTPGVLAYSTNVSWVPTAAGSVTSAVSLSINAAGQATLIVGGTTIFNNVQLPAGFLSANKSNWKHVFSSRSGGVAGGFGLDNMVIQANNYTSGTNTYLSSVSTTTTFYVSEMGVNGCPSARTPVTVTVTSGDPVDAQAQISGSPVSAICVNGSFDLVPVQSGSSNNYTFTWTCLQTTGSGLTGSVGGGTSTAITPVSVAPTVAGTYSYVVSYTDGVCSGADTVVVTVNMLPVTPTPAASANNFCGSGTFNLGAYGAGSSSNVLFQETFETFPSSNFLSTGSGTTVSSNTTYYSQGSASVRLVYAVSLTTASTNNSYVQQNNINLNGYTSAQLTFSHICAMEGPTTTYDVGYVQYSTDGGATWTTFPTSSYAGSGSLITTSNPVPTITGTVFSVKSYPDWISTFTSSTSTPGTGPASSLWKTETINIPAAALTSSQFRVRFMQTSDISVVYYGWLIDNIQILGTTNNTYSWTSTPSGFTSTDMNPVGVTAVDTTVYTVIATNPAGCTSQGSVTVNVTDLPPAPTAGAASTQCGYGIPTVSVSSNSGAATPIYNWYNAASGGTLLQSSASATYTGYISTTTDYYVSELVGVCESPRVQVTANVTQPDSIYISGPVATCLGSATTFNIVQSGSTNVYTYAWSANPSSGSGLSGTPSGATETFTPTATGTYTYTVIGTESSTSCTVIDTHVVSVYIGLSGSVTATQISSCVNASGLITPNVTGAGTIVNNDFTSSTLPSNMTSAGNDFAITGGRMQLTSAQNSKNGGVLITNTTGLANDDFQIDFDFITTSGGVAPADGLSYSYGDDVVALPSGTATTTGVTTLQPENGSGTKLKLCFDAINNTGGCPSVSNGNPSGIYLMYNETTLHQGPTCGGVLYYSSDLTWRATASTGATTHVTIKINALGQISMWLNGIQVVTNVQLPASYLTEDKSSWKHAFAARTGGLNEGHYIDNLLIQYNNFYEYSINGGASWTTTSPIVPPGPGTYSVDARYVTVPACSTNLGSVTINTPAFTTTASSTSVCAYSTSMPVLSFTPSFAGGATYQWESSPAGLNTWTPVSGASDATYSPGIGTITANTDFRCVISCSGVPVAGSPSSTLTITVDAPVVSSTTPGSRCGVGTVVLGATGTGTTLNWYAASTGGTALGSGNSFTTPVINSSTTYYVAAASGTSSNQVSNNGVPTVTTSTQNTGLLFNLNVDVTLNSIDVYSSASGTATVTILNSALATIYTSPALPISNLGLSTPQTLSLGVTIPAGTDYRILVSNTGNALGYHTGSFPSPLGNGVGSITNGATATGTTTLNYFVYNMNTSVGCESSRTPVLATVTAAPSVSLGSDVTICNGQSTTLNATSGNDPDYSYVFNTGYNGASYSVSPSATTTYIVTATDTTAGPNAGCAAKDTIIVNVNPVPSTPTITQNPLVVCGNNPVSLVASSTQPGVAQVGTATTTTSSNGISSFTGFYEGSKIQYLITAAELNALGVYAGQLTSLAFNVTTLPTTNLPLSGYSIKIGSTSNTSLSNYETGLTQVYSAPTSYAPVLGWNTFNFSAPYNWDGVSSVVFEICHNNDQSGTCTGGTGVCYASGNATVEYSLTSGNTVYGKYGDNGTAGWDICGGSSLPANTIATFNNRPNMKIGYGATTNFLWSTGGTDDTLIVTPPIGSTTYSVTATNVFGCTSSNSITVNAASPAQPYIVTNDTSLCAPSVVDVIVGDSGPYSGGYPSTTNFEWFGLSGQIVPPTPGLDTIPSIFGSSYFVLVTLPNGCTAMSDTAYITTKAVAIVDTIVNASCSSLGSIKATVTQGIAPYNYVWSTDLAQSNVIQNTVSSSTQDMISNLAAGTYYLSVSDEYGLPGSCSSGVLTYVVGGATPITIDSTSQSNVVCNGQPDGTATVYYSGGVAPISVQWSTGSTSNSIGGLVAGTYTVIVTDASSCADTAQVVITEPAILTATLSSTPESAPGALDGTVSAVVSGGTTPYQIDWYDLLPVQVGSGSPLGGLGGGFYQVFIQDSNLCFFIDTVEVTTISNMTLNLTLLIEGMYDGAGGLVPALLNGGVGTSSTECDTIHVELRDQTSPTTVLGSGTAVLGTNGQAIITMPSGVIGSTGYIAVFHRNAVETWSDLVTFSATTNYNFTTAATQAYGSNQKEVSVGVWAFYSGDLSPQDGLIDVTDQGLIDNDIFNFVSGYVVTDITGDNLVDVTDQGIVDNNIFNFIGSIHP